MRSNFNKKLKLEFILIFSIVSGASAQDSSRVRKNEIWVGLSSITFKRAVRNNHFLSFSINEIYRSGFKAGDVATGDNKQILGGLGLEHKTYHSKNLVSYIGPKILGGFSRSLATSNDKQQVNKTFTSGLGLSIGVAYELGKRLMFGAQWVPSVSIYYSKFITTLSPTDLYGAGQSLTHEEFRTRISPSLSSPIIYFIVRI